MCRSLSRHPQKKSIIILNYFMGDPETADYTDNADAKRHRSLTEDGAAISLGKEIDRGLPAAAGRLRMQTDQNQEN
jgi:hypothetical protein